VFLEFKTAFDVAKASFRSSEHQVEVARAALARADEELAKTTIASPITGTVSKLNSQLGERVVGTAMMTGTEIMTLADLNEMEARVDIGEMDVVLMAPGQVARLEVDAFRDKKFSGTVSEVANSSKGSGQPGGGGNPQDATRFEVKIRIKEKEPFRPGMSVTAEIETRYRTNTLTVPIASITRRMKNSGKTSGTNTVAAATNSPASTNAISDPKPDKKTKEDPAMDVVFIVNGGHAKMLPVKYGIMDDTYYEITEGLKEGDEIITGGFRAISRDLEDGKKIRKGAVGKEDVKEKK
jgi:HlyD family secretion protein